MEKKIPKAVLDWQNKISRLAGEYETTIFKKVFIKFVRRHHVYEPPELAWEEIIEDLIKEKGWNYPESAK